MIKGRETFKIFESNIRLKMVAGLSNSVKRLVTVPKRRIAAVNQRTTLV